MSTAQMFGSQFIQSATVDQITDQDEWIKTSVPELAKGDYCAVMRYIGNELAIIKCTLSDRLTNSPKVKDLFKQFPGTGKFVLPVQEVMALAQFEWTFERELFGESSNVKIKVNDGKVSQVTLKLGAFSNDKRKNVYTATAERYNMVQPSDDELEDFNQGRKSCAAWVDESTRVAMMVSYDELSSMARAMGRKAALPPMISVVYQEPAQMQALIKQCGPSALIKGADTKL